MATSDGNNRLPRRICFSFAAYSKALIEHLRSRGIPIASGLSDAEFAAIESIFGFCFPPDLQSILREGLPYGAGFPNWRCASPQQLQILLSLPVAGLLHEISGPAAAGGGFWPRAWGHRPGSLAESIARARSLLDQAPKLVPVYRHFYVAAVPNLAGNPVFFVRGSEVRCCGLDLPDFFNREDIFFRPAVEPAPAAPLPAWAAKKARRVDVWTDLADGAPASVGEGIGLAMLMSELGWNLRRGGWGEEDVKEMLMMGETEGCDAAKVGDRTVGNDRQAMIWLVRLLGLALLSAGWSAEDVVYSLGGGIEAWCAPVTTWRVDPTLNEISLDF
ncbi:hypothetical protein AXF42_Ash019849 [Apostasia shenzhenica]|uniref:Uncharacterized protein n=1 Tax=Apostasia shenzhenica TaxID=1088818 RepID=A0A2I0ARG6_9ASPA|nr:hypothetical protein AXF42_Ash019849 [Apostasia shenzhenica]